MPTIEFCNVPKSPNKRCFKFFLIQKFFQPSWKLVTSISYNFLYYKLGSSQIVLNYYSIQMVCAGPNQKQI